MRYRPYITAFALLPLLSATNGNVFAGGCADLQFDILDHAAGDSPRAVAMGDLDGDGDVDLAIANSWTTSGIIYHGTEGVHVMLNNGDGTYAPRQFLSAGTAPQSIALGDIDGDDDLDMVVAELGQFGNEWMNYGVNVLLNDGTGGFGPATLHPLDPGYVEPRSAVLGDLDGDDDLDVVVTVGYSSFQHSEVAVMLNDGEGSLGDPQYFSTGYGPHCVALADLDGDGNLDAVTANYSANTISRLYGDGAGGFGAPLHGYAGDQPRAVTLVDLDGDGVPDRAIANHDGMLVQLSTAGTTFYPVGLRPSWIAADDLDADGSPDLVVCNSLGDNVSILRNNGAGGFVDETFIWTGDAPYGATIGDVDGDGDADVAVANLYDDTITILRNNCALPCGADFDASGDVGSDDLLTILATWGPCNACPSDLDDDGAVDVADLLILLAAWGPCP